MTVKAWRRLSILLALAVSMPLAAMYRPPDIDDVPIDRLVRNLEAAAAKNPDDAQVWINLARLHGIAFAQKSATVAVIRGREDAGPFFGFEPENVPFARAVKPAPASAAAAARENLDKAIGYYRRALALRPDDLRIQLGLAWCLHQAGERTDAITRYRAVVEAAWKTEKDLTTEGLGWHSMTAEAAGYLIPLLQKENSAEIEDLEAKRARMGKVLRPMTPIAVPLRDGLDALGICDAKGVLFDADGSGLRRRWTWITPDAGWVVFDPKHRGHITSALQMFGSVTFWLFWPSGYDALAALDDDGNGELRGTELAGLAIWRDADGDGVSDEGEVQPLAARRIVALSTRAEYDPRHPDEILWSPRGVTFDGGATRPTFDLILHQR